LRIKGLVIILILGFLVGCSLVQTPTPFTETPSPEVSVTPTMTETSTVEVEEPTRTPNSTNTPTMVPTPTQITVPTSTPTLGCSNVPCGPNLFINPSFEGNYVVYNQDRFNQVTPQDWYFESLTGSHPRRPEVTLDVPESGERLGMFYPQRVDRYQPGINDKSAVWFKAWGITNSGLTQRVTLVEGQRYVIGAMVSTWAADLDNHPETGDRSLLNTEDDRRNVEWAIRVNYQNGEVFGGNVLDTYGYSDGVYDYAGTAESGFYYTGNIRTSFVTPTDPNDSDNLITVNLGFTASNLWGWGTTDYHIDNSYLYCMTCGYETNLPTQTPFPTPTPLVVISTAENIKVVVVADTLRVRRGANVNTPVFTLPNGSNFVVRKGQEFHVYVVLTNETDGEMWARIDDPAVCTQEPCDDSQWIAVRHSVCDSVIGDGIDDNICSELTNE
jgi:hypothetical protein